ncbi:MAG TPA: OadG family protein [Bacillota bacterium]|nr:OadG family protein [Bacillota bacterium]
MTNFSDTFTYALIVTLFGMGIVFLVLILLQYMLKAMEIIFHREKKAAPAAAPAAAPVAAPQVNEAEEASDDQLAAVITAAVISCLGGNSNIAVRNIRRVEDLTPAWGKASRTEQMAVRF